MVCWDVRGRACGVRVGKADHHRRAWLRLEGKMKKCPGQWYYKNRAGKIIGPLTKDELRDHARVGKLTRGDLLRADGATEWTPARETNGLFPAGSRQHKPGIGTILRTSAKWLGWLVRPFQAIEKDEQQAREKWIEKQKQQAKKRANTEITDQQYYRASLEQWRKINNKLRWILAIMLLSLIANIIGSCVVIQQINHYPY